MASGDQPAPRRAVTDESTSVRTVPATDSVSRRELWARRLSTVTSQPFASRRRHTGNTVFVTEEMDEDGVTTGAVLLLSRFAEFEQPAYGNARLVVIGHQVSIIE